MPRSSEETDTRPLLVGESNPHSRDPKDALAPYYKGSSGHRLWRLAYDRDEMLSELLYLLWFDRVNLCLGRAWDEGQAEATALELTKKLSGSGRSVVLLGRRVQGAFKFRERYDPLRRWESEGVTYYHLPHPSGRCRWYNHKENKAAAGDLLLRLIKEAGGPDLS